MTGKKHPHGTKNEVSVKIDTDEKKIDELLSRSIASVLPTKEAFKEVLMSGKRLRFYIGTDATGPQLHLGHSTNYILLEKFRQLGHEIIILFGDYTALIGDPTDKEAARKQQTPEEVANHIRDWKDQVSKIVDFTDGSNPAKILKNSEWLSTLTFEQLIDIASSFTVQHMLERDMFEKRIESGKPVYLHEFFYPLMQGYDSVAMNVDVEVGGTDQTFNMLAGRILQRKYNQKEKFVIATTLLENPVTGKKLMSKSEGGYIALNDSPAEMYGKTMALPDVVVRQMFIDTTLLPLSKIEEMMQLHPRDAKMKLGKEIVSIYWGEKAAEEAESSFVQVFQEGSMPADIPTIEIKEAENLSDTLLRAGVVSSKSDFRRLLEGGAITKTGTNQTISADGPAEPATLRIGKKRFLKIV